VGAGVTGQPIPKFDLAQQPNPITSIYKTGDGRFIALVVLQADRFWADLCTRLGREDMIDDERFANAGVRFQNRRECVTQLRATFESQPLAHWEQALADFAGVWDSFQSAPEIHADPQVQANGYLPQVTDANGTTFALAANPVQFDETPPTLRPAPAHGEHTDEILQELGYDWEQIIALKVDGATT
jgi:crotonobetainyl-CoA:carnitine CoA-transferase CaiB-like acyl-CoA transferase